jgi:hypothetical protein
MIMIKRFKDYIGKDKETVYYNSHGSWTTFSDLREIETVERENYPAESFNDWQSKYDIKDNDSAIWVTPNPNMACRYLFPAEYWEELYDMNMSQIKRLARKEDIDIDLFEVTDKAGFIIPESDDGDEGYIFIKR